jgi:hypothetical protein
VYESLDEGDTLTEIGPGISINGSGSDPIGYGAAGNPDMLYVGAGTEVFVRTAAAPAALTASAAFPGVLVVDLAIDPSAPDTAFVAGSAQVFLTTDAGTTWTDITGNLGGLATGAICSLVFRSSANEAVVIGTDTGVFFASAPAFDTWNRLGECLPRVQVFDLDYDPTDRVLVAGTLGRGAWILENQ